MEAVVIFVFFGLYIFIRVLMGGGESAWEKQAGYHKEGMRLFKARNWEEADAYFTQALKKRPLDVLVWIMSGEMALYRGEVEVSLAHGQKALRMDNTIWQGHYLMARALQKFEQPEEAVVFARKAAWFGRNVAETHYLLGSLELELGQVDAGLQHMLEAYKQGAEEAAPYIRNRKFSES